MKPLLVFAPTLTFSLVFSGCSNNGNQMLSCSKTNALSIPERAVSKEIMDGSFSSAWGGVLDLLEQPESPNTSARLRCTFRMDYIPEVQGKTTDSARIALWTAEHCLKWTNAFSAEVNLFDPQAKKYIRFRADLDDMVRFRQGAQLFSELAPDVLPEYLLSAARPEKGIIERGIPICKSDSKELQAGNTNVGVVCSSVLDLARIEGTVHTSDQQRADVTEALTRMREFIKRNEDDQLARVNALKLLIPTAEYDYFMDFQTNWRTKISLLTKWRGYEGIADLIERVRQCNAAVTTGICSSQIKEFFADPLSEYGELATAGKTYPEFLKDEAYTPLTATSGNLLWLLYFQKNLNKAIRFSDQITFDSNFLRNVNLFDRALVSKTTGDTGPVSYVSMPVAKMINTAVKPLAEHFTFNEKTLLFSYDINAENGELFLLQPGDSGTVLVVGNQPVGVVSTVNGDPTSGGASTMPLPEIRDEETSDEETSVVISEKSPVSAAKQGSKQAVNGCK
jgi:hypothetical protein